MHLIGREQNPGIDAKESIPGLIKILQIQALSAWAISVLIDIRNPFSEEYTSAKQMPKFSWHISTFLINQVFFLIMLKT
jgi:hypothetical protein